MRRIAKSNLSPEKKQQLVRELFGPPLEETRAGKWLADLARAAGFEGVTDEGLTDLGVVILHLRDVEDSANELLRRGILKESDQNLFASALRTWSDERRARLRMRVIARVED